MSHRVSIQGIIVFVLFFAVAAICQATESEGAGFDSWVQQFKGEAITAGISSGTLENAFSRVSYNELVIKLDRNQPEFKLNLSQYLSRTISSIRVKKGRNELNKNYPLLEKVARKYGVPPHVLVALWGIETDFGRVTGGFPIIEALATLSYDPRRSAFFKKELLDALHLLDDGKVSMSQMEGSWAGAMGYLQFLPSVFRKYGVDFEPDGKIEIWQQGGDLFASGANYLSVSGWQPGWKWGREVLVPSGLDPSLIGLSTQKDLSYWQGLGVRTAKGASLPAAQVSASLIHPDKSENRYFLIYDNFRVLMKWNRSTYYALAVGMLSDSIKVNIRLAAQN